MLQKFHIRALQTALRRERKPHETNILSYEPGRSTAGVTGTMRHVFRKAADCGVGAFVASADVEGAIDCVRHEDVRICPFAERCSSWGSLLSSARTLVSRTEQVCQMLKFPLIFCMFVVHTRGVWKDQTCGTRCWTIKELASDLQRTIAKAQKRRRGSSGEVMKNEGRVLHHLCWADDSCAMAFSMDHLTRILGNMTNFIEQLGMQWKEKSLTIVAGPYKEVQDWRCC